MRWYWLAFGCLVAVLIGNAWVSDDALITLRYALNTSHGFGAVFEWGERVQGYTHPLWFLILTGMAAIHGPLALYAQLLLGPFLVGISAIVWRRMYPQSGALPWCVLALCLSNGFVDFASSGLEGGLAVFLGTCLWRARRNASYVQLALLGALLCLTRTDYVLLVLPLCVSAGTSATDSRFRPWHGLVFLAPLLVWHVGAFLYYGDPLPNTYYAKTSTLIPRAELISQGLAYLGSHVAYDAGSLWAVVAGLSLTVVRRSVVPVGLAAGLWLYVGYTVWIGGDFMIGRFLQLPVLWSLLLGLDYERTQESSFSATALVRRLVERPGGRVFALVLLATVLWSAKAFHYGYGLFGEPRFVVSNVGVLDERSYYANRGLGLGALAVDKSKISGLVLASSDWDAVVHTAHTAERPVLSICGTLGWRGILQANARLVDACGLTDALVGRVKFAPTSGVAWRMGHFNRKSQPEIAQYFEVLKGVRPGFDDPELQLLYTDIQMMTRADIMAPGRFQIIVTRFLAQFFGIEITPEE